MTDNLTPEHRRKAMSSVKQKDTAPELLVRKILFSKGFRYRKNVKSLPGNPDIVLAKYKTVVFVHGCFWHQHQDCARSRRPTTKVDFWNNKLDKNTVRDALNIKLLKKSGWKVVVVWECELKRDKIDALTKNLEKKLIKNAPIND